jgi:hypothetical protein
MSVAHATLLERIRFGYEAYGYGPRLNMALHQASEAELHTMASHGDAGAATELWQRLKGSGPDYVNDLSRMTEAEDVAIEQARVLGQTYLIAMTAQRYLDVDPQKAAAWYRLGEKLGDPVCAYGLKRAGRLSKIDPDLVEQESAVLQSRVEATDVAADSPTEHRH